MQQPTFTGIHIRTVADAHVIFHAVTFGLLHMVSRRLGPEERQFIQSGSVFIWEERPPLAEANGVRTRFDDVPARGSDLVLLCLLLDRLE